MKLSNVTSLYYCFQGSIIPVVGKKKKGIKNNNSIGKIK